MIINKDNIKQNRRTDDTGSNGYNVDSGMDLTHRSGCRGCGWLKDILMYTCLRQYFPPAPRYRRSGMISGQIKCGRMQEVRPVASPSSLVAMSDVLWVNVYAR